MGLLHVVVGMCAEDRAYLERHTLGWDAFRDRILQFPLARIAQVTGIARIGSSRWDGGWRPPDRPGSG